MPPSYHHLSIIFYFFQFLFQQLGIMISIVKQHIRNYLDDIFDLIGVRSQLLGTNFIEGIVYVVLGPKEFPRAWNHCFNFTQW